ncbi:MAG TPA: M48 family metalloprotease [Blastocatellia bacterium]|nr:M48 family metalloprotease [Blastocatellia bacterium]
MYELLGISLALAALLSINALASLAATIIWRSVETRAMQWTATRRAGFLFALRVLPAAFAACCVVALLIPAWAIYEPYHTDEIVSARLAVLALISIAGIALAIGRGLASWLVTRRLVKNWLSHAVPVQLENLSLPAYRLPHRFPVIAITGTWRPRLFIAEQVFEQLSSDELNAAIAHECGHLRAGDNLKRPMLRACRDALSIVPCGRALDRAWAAAAEEAADEYAARAGASAALDLASALVKISRLIPAGSRPALPTGAWLIGAEVGSVAARVKRLTELAGPDNSISPTQSVILKEAFIVACSAMLVLLTIAASNQQLLALVHSALELIVSALQ